MTPVRVISALAVGLVVAAAAVVLIVSGGGGHAAGGTTQRLGDTTSKDNVVGALESTGYDLRFRRTPRLEGYEIVSGEAVRGSERVQFTVEIRLAGPFEGAGPREPRDPQPPVLRYGAREGGTLIGNVIYKTVNAAPDHVAPVVELQPDRGETRMAVQLGVALRELFAPRFRPEG